MYYLHIKQKVMLFLNTMLPMLPFSEVETDFVSTTPMNALLHKLCA